ncbi:MAG: DUF2330 domain-containing protein [bacterium]
MNRLITILALWSALFLMVAVDYDSGESYCVLFPQNGRDIFGVAQRTILVVGDDEVALIPQVHFEGDARDFGILVPVPAEPRLSMVGANIFSEASFMTQPLVRQSSSGCGCDDDNIAGSRFILNAADDRSLVTEDESGVTVIYEDIVGMFQAAVLQATNAQDLTEWLNTNGYWFNPDDTEILDGYVADDWFFVAMKFDTTQVPQNIDRWWNATTSPAKITFDYSQSSLTYPLKISAISTNERTEVLVYTISKNPMRFPGAEVEYANQFDVEEVEAASFQYPTLASFIAPGAFVTKLRRTFAKSEMQADIQISVTDDRREFRDILYVNNGSMGVWGALLFAVAIYCRRRKTA